jgi:hypothetical protein
VNGAHWGDLDGDGTDEMIIGMNGDGGLHIVSAQGVLIRRIGDIGNVWNQAVIPSAKDRPAMIFATEAGGSVRLYDAQGKRIQEMAPLGKYYAEMNAAVADEEGNVQVIAASEDIIAAFDKTGKVSWRTALQKGSTNWRVSTFGHADVNNDGESDWIFRRTPKELIVATAGGMKLMSISTPSDLRGFACGRDAEGHAFLAILLPKGVQIYRLVKAPVTPKNT